MSRNLSPLRPKRTQQNVHLYASRKLWPGPGVALTLVAGARSVAPGECVRGIMRAIVVAFVLVCLRDDANPYRKTDQRFIDIDVDCAKLPYLLRGYYAWKNVLPFGYVDGVSGEGGDLRYTKVANRATGRHEILDRGEGIDGPAALRQMMDTVFSGTYRTDAAERRGVLSDFYSPALQPGSIHPGTVVYDVNGHVGIVWKVDGDGRIYYMDAHPDFTITRSVYGAQFGQSPMRLGGGLKNWRPFKLVGAHHDADGHLIGGRLAYAENDQIADFSLVQYTGTEPNPRNDVAK